MSKTQDLYKHAKKRIPGGVQLLSKSPEQFAPGQWPAYYSKAQGCEVWDLDGNHYYDMTTNGIGACLLGFADPDVTKAVVECVQNGSMCTLNSPNEVKLADKLCEMHPWAESVRFARTGGETCAVAIRIARATTGRDLVLICGYHGWSDWYLAANLSNATGLDDLLLPGLKPAGVPKALTGTTLTCVYEDYKTFDKIIAEYGDRLACVIMEPYRHVLPDGKFLRHVRQAMNKCGGLLIFDEITIGFRLCYGGAHKLVDVQPDIATFAKALGNGHPIGAIIGTKKAMEGAHNSFISSTYWTESVGFTAALATLEKMEKVKIWEHVARVGSIVQKDWLDAAERHGLKIHCSGVPCLAHFDFLENKKELKTLYTVLMLKEGFLGNTAIYPTLAHTDEVLAKYRVAIDKVFAQIAEIQKGGVEAIKDAIGGPVCLSGFARLLD